ncbi:MAG: hypothetical protein U0931_19840 [Vulcanimicrobiota bacterium]
MNKLLLGLGILWSAGAAWSQPAPEGQLQYAWSYALPQENRWGPEVVLKAKATLPAEGRLLLRLRNGPSKVTVVVFNSSRGRMQPRELPTVFTLEPDQAEVSEWKLGSLAGSKTYLALLRSDSSEANSLKTLRRDWEKARDQGRECSGYAQQLYDQVVIWHSENKGGSALAGDTIQEVGAVRAGAAGRPVEPLPPTEPPPNWAANARRVQWTAGQHPVLICRFATRP